MYLYKIYTHRNKEKSRVNRPYPNRTAIPYQSVLSLHSTPSHQLKVVFRELHKVLGTTETIAGKTETLLVFCISSFSRRKFFDCMLEIAAMNFYSLPQFISSVNHLGNFYFQDKVKGLDKLTEFSTIIFGN